jgi:2-methylcitrate dehydratase PrpD
MPDWQRLLTTSAAPRALTGVALVLLGAVAGLAAGQALAQRSAHRTGACSALNMAAALGYLDAEQQRRVRHALATAVNPDADLFSGGPPSLQEACGAGVDR